MKKLSTLFLLLATTFANAQEHKGFGVSLRTGASSATQTLVVFSTYTKQFSLFVPDYGIGIFYDGHISKGLYYRGQVSFLSRNWKESNVIVVCGIVSCLPSLSYTKIDIQRNHFLSPEFSFRYQFGEKQIKPFLQLGLRADIYLKSQSSSGITDVGSNNAANYQNTSWNKVDGYEPIMATAILGGGIIFKRLSLGIEYNPSLSLLLNTTVRLGGSVNKYTTLNTKSTSLTISYRF